MPDVMRGDVFLLKVGDGNQYPEEETFETIAGLRPTSMSINGSPVDVTHKGSGGWRALLPGGGVKTLTLTAGGVYMGDVSQKILRTLAMSGAIRNAQLDDGEDIVQAGFQFSNYEHSGGHEGEQQFSITLENSGIPAVAPVA